MRHQTHPGLPLRWRVPGADRATVAWAAAIVMLAAAVRIPLLPHESWDYLYYVGPWYGEIERTGLWDAMGREFANYTPPYLYLLGFAEWLPLPKLLAIKLVSMAFEVILAAVAVAIVRDLRPGRLPQLVTFAAVLLAPSVVLNGASWAQCDAIFTAPLLAGVWLAMRGRYGWAMLAVGISLAFKVQAVFILPLFAVLTLRNPRLAWTWLLLPVPYLVGILPSWLARRSIGSLLNIYPEQAGIYDQLTLNAPSVYAWVNDYQTWGPKGTVLGLAVIGVACLVLWRLPLRITPHSTLLLGLAFLLLVPFVLPHMHDRYFYPADVAAIAYAVTRPDRWFVPVLVLAASTFSYMPFLYGVEPVPFPVLAGSIAAALAVTLFDIAQLVRTPHAESEHRRAGRTARGRALTSASG